MNKTLEGLKEKTKEIFDMERKLDKLYEERREIINFLGLNKKPQQQPPLSGFLIPTSTTEAGDSFEAMAQGMVSIWITNSYVVVCIILWY